jgi:hypothetical protein
LARSLLVSRATALREKQTWRTDNNVVTVKPGARQEWLVAIEGRVGDLAFSTHQLAVDFARAYAKLRRAGRMQVFNAKGGLEHEEKVDLSSQQSGKA